MLKENTSKVELQVGAIIFYFDIVLILNITMYYHYWRH
jgi:hypothetical protein